MLPNPEARRRRETKERTRQPGSHGLILSFLGEVNIRKGFPLTFKNRGYLDMRILWHSSLRGKRTHTHTHSRVILASRVRKRGQESSLAPRR